MRDFGLHIRIPSWATDADVRVNGAIQGTAGREFIPNLKQTASGVDPRASRFWPLRRTWSPGDVVEIDFETVIQLRRADPKVKGHQGKAAVTRGPLVYCLESVDNPDVDIFNTPLDPASLTERFDPELFSGTTVIEGKSAEGLPLTLIPYHLWGNRGPSQMTVWIATE